MNPENLFTTIEFEIGHFEIEIAPRASPDLGWSNIDDPRDKYFLITLLPDWSFVHPNTNYDFTGTKPLSVKFACKYPYDHWSILQKRIIFSLSRHQLCFKEQTPTIEITSKIPYLDLIARTTLHDFYDLAEKYYNYTCCNFSFPIKALNHNNLHHNQQLVFTI